MNFLGKFFKSLFLFLLVALPMFFAGATAGVPLLINFQGRLYDSSDNLLGGTGTDYCFKFALYDASTAGAKVWPTGAPSPTTLVVRNGVFDAYIGSADTLDFDFQTTDTVYVDVQVSAKSGTCDGAGVGESYETLDPRPRVASSGYAINSKMVGGFIPAQSATDNQIPVLTSGQLILSHATAAGIASTGANPFTIDAGTSGVLNLNNTSTGNLLLGGGSASTGCTLTNTSGAFTCTAGFSGTTLTGTSYTEGGVIFAGSGGALTEDDTNFFWDNSSKELGIGTAAPDSTLHVLDSGDAQVRIQSSGANHAALVMMSSGRDTWIAGNSVTNASAFDFYNATDNETPLSIDGTGNVSMSGGLGSTGCTVTNATGAFACNGNFTTNKADPAIIFDTATATDTDFWAGVTEDAGSDDDDLFQIGDGTSPGTNPFLTINTSGQVGIGTTPDAFTMLDINTDKLYGIQIKSSGTQSGINFDEATDTFDPFIASMRARGTQGAKDNILSGDQLFHINAGGYGDTFGVTDSASIGFVAEANFTDSDFSGALTFSTQAATDSAAVERVRINNLGNVGIGTTAPDRKLEINSATGDNLRLTYNDSNGSAANYVDLLTTSSGDFTVTPSGGDTSFTGNVGVNNTSPAQRLTVSDGVILSNFGTSSTPTALGGATPNVDANAVFASGKYAYVGLDSDGGAGNEFQIFDIHNPASIPASIGGISYNFNFNTIYVAGNYAYVGTSVDGSGNEFRIYDITNPSAPSLTGSVDVAEDVTSIFVVGRYAYLTKTDNSGSCTGTTLTGCEFSIYDVIDPSSPAAIGGEDFVDAATHYRGNSVYVQGKYAFIGRDTSTGTCSGTTVTGCEFIIYDISNPFDPSAVNGVNVAKEVNSVFASGAYAYIGTDSGSGNEFSIYEISDASSIGAEVGGLEVGADVNSVTTYGKYSYIGAATVSGNDFKIVDVLAPAAPTAVGGVDVSIGVNEVFVNGKYLYTALDTVSGNEFRAYDLSGVDAPTANIGALAAGSFSVTDNARIDNDLHVGNAINVGIGGMQSLGSMTIVNTTSADSSTNSVAGFQGIYTFNPSGGGTQVGNRFVVTNAPTSSANTSVNTIIRTIDDTSLANTVRGIEIVSNAGSNTAGTNTGLRATGATFGVQGLTNGLAGGVSLPAALYGESTGTTQGDVLRLYTASMTSAPAMAQIYHETSTFTGAAILIDMAVGSGTFSGNFLDFQNNNVQKFLVTSAGVTSMGLSATASTTAVCSSLANTTAPTAGTAYQIRDCSGAPAADYAEMYPVEEGAEYGDVVVTGTQMVNTYDTTDGNIDWTKVKGEITQLVKSSAPYQRNVIGVVSDNYGDFTSAGNNLKEEDNPMPIALNGRVPVKIALSSGEISPGDYLTTSAEPGRAMKADGSGTVIGKSLGYWRADMGTETVMIYVEQGYYDGTSFAAVEEVIPEGETQTPESSLAFANFLTEGVDGAQLNLSALFSQGLSLGLDIITTSLTASAINVSALDVSDQANFSGLTFFSSDVEFLAGVTFDESVMFKSTPTFNKDTAGFAVVKEGDQSVRVTFEKEYAMTPVVTTTMTFEATDNIDDVTTQDIFAQNISSLVKEKDETGFTIVLSKPAPFNLRFSWVALGVDGATIFESLGEGLEFINETEPENNPVPQPQSQPEPTPEVVEDPAPEPEIISEPTPEPTPEPEVIVEPTPEPEVIVEPALEPTSSSVSE